MLRELHAILLLVVGLAVLSACGSSDRTEPTPEAEAPAVMSSEGYASTEATSSQDSGAPVFLMIDVVPGL
jgi:hypothetical protein